MQTDFDERLLIDETNWEGGDYGAIMLKVKNSGSVAAKISLDIDVEGELSDALWYSLQTLTSQYGAEGATMLNMRKYYAGTRPSGTTEGPVPMSKIGEDSTGAITVYPSGSEEDCYVYYLLELACTLMREISIRAKYHDGYFHRGHQAPDEADGFGKFRL